MPSETVAGKKRVKIDIWMFGGRREKEKLNRQDVDVEAMEVHREERLTEEETHQPQQVGAFLIFNFTKAE